MKQQQVIITNGDPRPLVERPLAIALQFYGGDKLKALALARLLADIEPVRRDDVALIFAQRFDVQMTSDIYQTQQYCSKKFPIFHIRSEREQVGHPNGCFGLWAGTAEQCYKHYCQTWPYHSIFFIEPDGVPLRKDWINLLKKRHAETLAMGKRVTGHIVPENPGCCAHVNGTMVMHLSCWADHPSFQVCRRDIAWDVFHAQALLGEANDNKVIVGLQECKNLPREVFEKLGDNAAWLTGVKDGTSWQIARELVAPIAMEQRPRRKGKRR